MITREFNLYLHAGHSIPLVINANQYDHGEQWLFTLFNSDGTQYVPSSGAIVGIKSDNLGIINSGSVDSNGRVVINETQQMTAAVGKAVFELLIDDSTHGTANFVVLVEAKPGDNADLSETDISMIEQAIEAAANIKPYGSPLVASTVAGMTDHDKVYVYTGSETGYTSGHWYYYDGDSWEDGGVYNSVAVQTDTTLALSGVAADAKKTGDEISDLKSEITNSMPHAVKLALDTILHNVGFKNDDVYTDELATFHAWATAVNLLSISAVFEQGTNVIYDTDSLDSLKQYLTVTASYDDGTSGAVSGYTLSGELAEGTSTITATYEGKSASFNVTVEHALFTLSSPFESTGSNYIDTGVAWETNKQYSLECEFNIDQFGTETAYIYGDTKAETSKYTALADVQHTSGTNKGKYVWGSGFGFEVSKNFADVNQTIRFVFTMDISSSGYTRNWYIKNETAGTSFDGTQNGTDVLNIKGYNIFIGKQETSLTDNGFVGTISDFKIFDRILTSAEINSYLNG